jgi:hypothetical protein
VLPDAGLPAPLMLDRTRSATGRPTPVIATVAGLAAPAAETTRVASAWPPVVGRNVTETVHEADEASAVHVLVAANAACCGPAMLTATASTAGLPALVTVTVFAVDVVPTPNDPKSMAVGCATTSDCPVPVRETDSCVPSARTSRPA